MRMNCLVVIVSILVLLGPVTAGADYIAVSGINDDIAENNYCSLREAVQSAIDEDPLWSVAHGCVPGNGDDTIILPAGRYSLWRGQLEITGDSNDIKIEPLYTDDPADVVILDGGDNNRIAYIGFQTGDVTFERITFTNGWASTPTGDKRGGAILAEVVEVYLDTCYIYANFAEKGGGIYLYESVLYVDDSSFTDNFADSPTAGTFNGGAIYASNSIIHAKNTTFSYNNAGLNGGALYLNPISTGWLRHVTITDGNCGFDDFATGDGGGVFLEPDATLNLAHTIIAGNHDLTNGDTKEPDCAGIFGEPTSHGYNIVGDNSDCQITAQATDQFGTAGSPVDPGLELLTRNSKGTKNHLPTPFGNAENGGSFTTGTFFYNCDGSGDQRGVTRPKCGSSGGICLCDIGAIELELTSLIFSDGFESGNTSAWQ